MFNTLDSAIEFVEGMIAQLDRLSRMRVNERMNIEANEMRAGRMDAVGYLQTVHQVAVISHRAEAGTGNMFATHMTTCAVAANVQMERLGADERVRGSNYVEGYRWILSGFIDIVIAHVESGVNL